MADENANAGSQENENTDTKPRPTDLPDDQSWDNKVEFSPEQQKRFNRLYGQVKTQDKQLGELSQMNAKLIERLEAQEQKTAVREIDGELADLRAAKKEALDAGDTDKVMEIDDAILDAKIKAKEASETPEPKKDPDKSNDDFDFTPSQKDRLIEWATERNDKGDVIRPWADPGHPKHTTAMKIAEGVLGDPEYTGADMEDILKEVDRVATLALDPGKAKRPGAAVLKSNGGPGNANKEGGGGSLTQDQKAIAYRMYPNLDTKDAEKKYGEAVTKWS